MKEMYETLLDTIKDNDLLKPYLQGDVPDFSNIWTNVMPLLSSGERILMEIALALYNGNGVAKISDIFMLDQHNQQLVLDALTLRFGYE